MSTRIAARSFVQKLECRTLLATVSWDGGGDGVNWDDAVNWSGNLAPVAGDDVVVNVAGSPAIVVRFSTPVYQSITNAESITIRGNGIAGSVGLYAGSDGVSNSGTITLTSVDAGWSAELNTAGSLANQASGVVQSLPGAGGPRSVTVGGTLNNAGSLAAQAGVDYFVAALNNTGSVSSTSRLTFIGTAGVWGVGTAVTGNVYQRNGSINVTTTTAAAGSAFTVLCEGTVTVLGNQSPVATIWVQGNNVVGGAYLRVPAAGATNSGIVRLESVDNAWDSLVIMEAAGTLTLASTGVIRSATGSGGARSVNGKVRTAGLFEAPGYFLNLFGTYEMNGGRATSDVQFRGVTLSTLASASSATTLILSGTTSLVGDITAGYTLWAQGNNVYGGAYLSVLADFANGGTIRLESISSGWDSSILLAAGATLTNNGVLNVGMGSGGVRALAGRLTNAAGGAINVEANIQLFVDAYNPVLMTKGLVVQSGSITVAAGGRFTIDRARVEYSRATSGDLFIRNSELDVAAGVATSTVIAEASNALVANASPNVTVWVQGNSLVGGSYLSMVAGGATNAGIIRLESIDAQWDSVILASNGLTNAATGVIRSNFGSGGSRSISGVSINRGRFEAPGYFLNVYNTHTADGGQASLEVIFRSVTLSTIGTYASATTLKLSGLTTLLTNVPANLTLLLQGNSIDGGATLNRVGNLTNSGTLRLESVDNAWNVSLLVDGDLVNNGSILGNVGSGGARVVDVSGNLDGSGITTFAQPGSSFIADRIRQSAFSLPAFSTATIRAGGTDQTTSKANFTIDPAGRFVVNDNAVIFDYTGASVLGAVGALMQSGYGAGYWNTGVGINSDVANPATGRTLGYAEGTDANLTAGTFAGLPVDATAVLVRQTLVGDTNLDRVVNFDDLLKLAQNYGLATGARWSQGDSFYDGNIIFDDLLGLAQQYGRAYAKSVRLAFGTTSIRGLLE